ncbi:MAG: hypothetical protein AB8B63_20215 [Granulosicoccus sp.]
MDQPRQTLTARATRKVVTAVGAIVFAALIPVSANAEYLGLITGREATPAKATDLSVELGFVTGDLGDGDYQNIAARVNYRLSPELVLMGTVGVGELGDTDGVPLGLAALFHLRKQRISQRVNIATKASYHFGDYSLRELDGDVSSLALDILVSGRNALMDNGLSWYSSFGFHRTTVKFLETDTVNNLGIGVGLVLPTGLGEAYFGIENIDGTTVGLGIRYFVR